MWQSTVYDVLMTMLVMAFVLCPGVLLTTALFPKRTLLWRLVIGNILGFLLLGWSILLLDLLQIRIDYLSIVITVVFCIMISLLVLWKLHGNEKIDIKSTIVLTGKKFLGFPSLVFFLFVVSLIAILPIAHANNATGFTEFYLAEGLQEKPPWREQTGLNEPVWLTAVIVNNEITPDSYTMQVVTEGTVLQIIDLGVLESEDKVAQQIILPSRDLADQQFHFFLYKGDSKKAYRILSFWLHA